MKKSLLVWLIVVCLAGIAVPLYAQEAGLTLKGVSDKVDAIVELVTSMLDRMSTFEQRLAVLEATDTPTPTTTPTETPTPTPTEQSTPTPTPTPSSPIASITTRMNVRAGPGTNYPIVGQAAPGDQYIISGRNPSGGWWQIIYGGQYAWVYSPLVTATNAEVVQVASFVPTPVPTQIPVATPIPPTAVPPPAAPSPADPCANIHCFFWLRNQDFTNNGGGELKLNIGFVHQGRGDEIQGAGGSYFVELHKDGVLVSAVDNTTRGKNNTHNGPQGNKYNYLKAVPLNQVPGGNVAGNYTIFVKNGIGERVSQTYAFTVSAGNGEIWLIFAQNN